MHGQKMSMYGQWMFRIWENRLNLAGFKVGTLLFTGSGNYFKAITFPWKKIWAKF